MIHSCTFPCTSPSWLMAGPCLHLCCLRCSHKTQCTPGSLESCYSFPLRHSRRSASRNGCRHSRQNAACPAHSQQMCPCHLAGNTLTLRKVFFFDFAKNMQCFFLSKYLWMDNKLLHGNHVPGGNSDPIESTQCNDRPGSNDWHCNDRLQKIIISHENTPNGYIHLSRTKHPDVMFYTGTCPFAVICVFETVGITFTPFEHERLANTLHV